MQRSACTDTADPLPPNATRTSPKCEREANEKNKGRGRASKSRRAVEAGDGGQTGELGEGGTGSCCSSDNGGGCRGCDSCSPSWFGGSEVAAGTLHGLCSASCSGGSELAAGLLPTVGTPRPSMRRKPRHVCSRQRHSVSVMYWSYARKPDVATAKRGGVQGMMRGGDNGASFKCTRSLRHAGDKASWSMAPDAHHAQAAAALRL